MAQRLLSKEVATPEARRLDPAIVRLGWISFLLDVGSEMIYPLIPLFLAATLGAPGLALGLVEGAAEGLLSIATVVAGARSDRSRRRVPFIRGGYALAAAAKPLLALAASWPAVLALRAADRLGKGIRTAARDALLADLARADLRGEAFGFHRSMDTAGAFTGVLLALLLTWLMPGEYRLIFALTAIPGAAAIVLTFTVREAPRAAPAPELGRASWRALPRPFWTAAGVLWLFALGNSSTAFLLLRARERGFGDVQVILAYALFNLVYALVSLPAGRWSDQVGRRRVVGAGWLLYALAYAGFAATDAGGVWALLAVYGAHMGLTQGVSKAWIADCSPAHARGTALGVYHTGLGLALLAASAVAGWMWDEIGPHAPFAFGAAVAAAALAALFAFRCPPAVEGAGETQPA